MSRRRCRILLYCAGRSGLGQTVRAARIARYISDLRQSQAEILIVTGVRHGDHVFRSSHWRTAAPREIVAVTTGAAESKSGESLTVLREAASRVMTDLVSDFRPDVFISTSHRGVAGEISGVSDALMKRHSRLVLALRDIYHPPEFASEFRAMSAAQFDLVLIGAPRAVTRWAPEGLLDGPLAAKVRCAGYLRPVQDQAGPTGEASRVSRACEARPGAGPAIVRCQVGGGRDGAPLAKAVIEAVDSVRGDCAGEVELHLATGPLMSRSDVQVLKSMSGAHTHVRTWSDGRPPRPHLVVSMAGYNSCVEAAWTGLPSILVPRDDPDDLEQAIRAELFSGWFPNIATTPNEPESIAKSISSALSEALRWPGPCGASPGKTQPDNFFALPRSVALMVLGER